MITSVWKASREDEWRRPAQIMLAITVVLNRNLQVRHMADEVDRAKLEIESELAYARWASQATPRLVPVGLTGLIADLLDRKVNMIVMGGAVLIR